MNEILILDFEGKMRAATKLNIPLPQARFVSHLQDQLNQRVIDARASAKPKRSWTAKAAIMALLLMVSLVILLGPSNVLAAFQRLAGYIPGIGFIQPELVLAEPISRETGDIILTIENFALSADESILAFNINGLSGETAMPISSYRETGSNPYLQTFDGTIYRSLSGHGRLERNGREWIELIHFPPLPLDSSHVFLVLDVALPGGTTETLKIDLPLQRVDGNSSPSDEGLTTELTAGTLEEIQIRVDGVAVESNQLVFNLVVDWQDPNWQIVEVIDFLHLGSKGESITHFASLVDSNGSPIPIFLNMMESAGTNVDTQASFVFSSEIPPSDIAFPLTLTLDALYVSVFPPLAEQPVFVFTPESEMPPGECHSVESHIDYYAKVTLVKVCSLNLENGMSLGGGGGGDTQPEPNFGLELWFSTGQDVLSISASDTRCRLQQAYCAGGSSIGRLNNLEGFLRVIQLYSVEPNWPTEFSIDSLNFLHTGPWTIEFGLTE